MALVKVEASEPGVKRTSARVGDASRTSFGTTEVRYEEIVIQHFDSFLTESPQTGGGSKMSSILYHRKFHEKCNFLSLF